MSNIVYLVVANSSQANINKTDPQHSSLELVRQMTHPESRQTRSELDSDRPGGTRSSRGSHGLGGDSSSHQRESDEFASTLGAYLNSEYQAHKFQHLLVAAPPHFLGELRHHLSDGCQKVLGKTVNKNLTRADEASVLEHFAEPAVPQ